MLVKVASISINPVDVKARRNDGVLSWLFAEKRPAILGWDISGEITEVGKDVKDFKSGDKVFGMVNFFGNGKAYAEYVAAPAELGTYSSRHIFSGSRCSNSGSFYSLSGINRNW